MGCLPMRVVLGLMETVQTGDHRTLDVRRTVQIGLKGVLTAKSLFYNDKCIFGEGQLKYRDNSDGHRKTATRKS